jgi:general secretion pathway protein G
MNKQREKNKGFTFIEVLVVTTIIAVLTAVGVVNFRVANKKARDGRRKADLEQIRAAVELYRTDEGTYPLSITFGSSLESATTVYMEEVPNDPLDSYSYYYNSADGSSYALCAALELDSSGSCPGGDCGDGSCNYQITNPL